MVYRNSNKQPNETLQKKYAEKATLNINNIIFFGSSVVWGYAILKDSTWLPGFLGGQNPNASVMNAMIKKGDSGFEVIPPGVVCYIFFTYGYHVESFITHLFFKEYQSDYRELLLHHIATCCLYAGFMMGNLFAIGTIIAWFHDIADTFVNLSRFANCVGMKTTASIGVTLLVISWAFTRCFTLPMYIYHIIMYYKHPEPSLQPIITFETIFLCVLVVLHYFWLYHISMMVFNNFVKGVQKDTLNRVEDTVDDGKDKKE